jgi:hypothetical protein
MKANAGRASFRISFVLPPVFDPGDVAPDEDAEEESDGEVHRGEDQSRHACACTQGDRGDHAAKSEEGGHVLEEGTVGIAADGSICGLKQLFELAQQDRDAEIEDDPLGVGLAQGGEPENAGRGEIVESSREQDDSCGTDDGDEPPAALEDAESGCAIVAGHQHGHLVACDGAEARVAEAEISGDGVDDHPFAVKRDTPEVQEDRDLNELDDGGREFPHPAGQEAEHQPSLCGGVHGHESGLFL